MADKQKAILVDDLESLEARERDLEDEIKKLYSADDESSTGSEEDSLSDTREDESGGDTEPLDNDSDQEEDVDDESARSASDDEEGETEEESFSDEDEESADTLDSEEKAKDPLKVMEKRYKDVQAWATKVAQQNAEMQARMQALEQALMQAGQGHAGNDESYDDSSQSTEDLLDEIREEYPEIAEYVEEQIQKKIEPLVNAQQQLAVERFVATVQTQHPDAFEVDNSPEFRSWMQDRGLWDHYDSAVKMLDAQKVGSYLELFKEIKKVQQLKAKAAQARATTQSKRQKAASAALESDAGSRAGGPRTQGTRKFTREQLARMTPEEFEAHEAEINAALAQGLIE